MTSENSLFIAHTPYHVILSYAIAAEDSGRSHLFVRPTGEKDEDLLELFDTTGVFETVQLLDDPFDEAGNHRSNWYWKRALLKNIRKLRSFLKTTDVDGVYAALDDRELVQAAMHYANKYGDNPTGIHLEDGCYDYDFYIIEWTPYRSDLFHAVVDYLLFGFWWERPPMVRGTTRHISESYATFPDLVRSELQDLQLHSVEPDRLRELGRSEELDNYLETSEITTEELSAIDVMVLLPLNNDAAEGGGEGAIFDELLQILQGMGYTVGLKYHPRQIEAHRQIVPTGSNVIEVPQEIPIELLLVASHTSITSIIGSVSTSLKSARWLDETVTAITIYPLLLHRGLTQTDVDRTKLMENFEEMGVQLVESADNLEGPV